MAAGKKSFLLYADYIDTIEELSDEEAGRLFKHIYRYVNDKNPVLEDRVLKIAFSPIQQTLKRDLKHWELIKSKKSEAGKVSAEKRQQNKHMLTGVEYNQHALTDSTVNVSVSDNVSVINNAHEEKIKNIKADQIWIEQVAMKYKLPVVDLTLAFDDFIQDLKLKDDLGKPEKDIKAHFINLMNIKDEKKRKEEIEDKKKNQKVLTTSMNFGKR